MLWKSLSFTSFISFRVITFAQSKPFYLSIYLSLVYNYEGKTKKRYSSLCRGPLMISLK